MLFCTSQVFHAALLSCIHRNRATSQAVGQSTPAVGPGWNCSGPMSTIPMDKFGKLMPVLEVSKRQILAIKAARRTQKVQLIKTVSKSLDHFGIRFLPQTRYSDNTMEQLRRALSAINMTFTPAQSFVLCIDSAHLVIPARITLY